MTIYPVHRSWRSILWFTAAVLLVFAVTIGLYRIAFAPPTADRWLMALSMAGLALAALLAGGTAYGLHWIQRAPRLGSTVFAGYALAGVFICLALGWLSLVLPLAPHERGLPLLLLFFVVSLALALGYLHASMVSARAEALIGVADALRLGHYHAHVDMAGHDQLARLGETLNSLAERLEATERKDRHLNLLRRDLQGWVGTDLRIPLAKASATVDAVAAGAFDNPETYLRFLRSAQRNIRLLSDLADDLYDMTQLDAGTLSLHLQPTDAEKLIAATVASLAHSADDKGILLSGGSTPGLPLIEVDSHQVERLLANLVAHALHRTPAGGVVKVNAYPMRQGVLFEVVDYFEGERPEEMAQLLGLFLDEEDARGARMASLWASRWRM